MADLVLNTEEKTTIGSRSSRRLQEMGSTGVLYGLGQDPEISVGYGDLRGALTTDAGLNTNPIECQWDKSVNS